MRITNRYVFFWRSFLGNWSKTPNGIRFDDKTFPTAEHVFMYIKAKTFGDTETMEKILKASSPKEAKELGRQVKGYKEDVWDAMRSGAMFDTLMARAKDDEKFRNALIEHSEHCRDFVEASPYDLIWGVGLSENDPGILDKRNWRGKNLLGETMTRVADWWHEESQLNKWRDSLLWCPSQCYYSFRAKNTGELKCLYLRWRHQDPWTAEIIPVNEISRTFENDNWIGLDIPFFKDSELDKLKEFCMEKLKELDLI